MGGRVDQVNAFGYDIEPWSSKKNPDGTFFSKSAGLAGMLYGTETLVKSSGQ